MEQYALSESESSQSFITLFFRWWYFEAPIKILIILKTLILKIADFFSFFSLLRTFFQPWKRDVMIAKSLNEKLQALALNMVSRLVGMIMRFFVIVTGLIFISSLLILGLLFFIIWISVPILLAIGLFKSIFLITTE